MQLRDGKQSNSEDKEYQVQENEQKHSNSDANSETLTSSPTESILSQPNQKTSVDKYQPLRDWLELIASVLVPLILGLFTYQQTQIAEQNRQQEQNNAKQSRDQEQLIAGESQRYNIISDYFDAMTQLQLDSDLLGNLPNQSDASSPESKKAQQIARARTLNALRQLQDDGPRKGQLLKFLYEAGLIGNQCQTDLKTLQAKNCQEPILDLGGAKLEAITLEPPIPLQGIDLNGALLAGAKLQGIDLTAAELERANLKGADLTGALLTDAHMAGVSLEGTVLAKAYLRRANLNGANLTNANLQEADLRNADLTGASLQGVDLKEALYNSATKFPDGFAPDGQGMRKVD